MKRENCEAEKILREINHEVAASLQELEETIRFQEAVCHILRDSPDTEGVCIISEQIIKKMVKTYEDLEYFEQISENSITCQNETHSKGNGSTGKYSSVIIGNEIIDADEIGDC